VTAFLNLVVAGLTSGAIYAIFGACLAMWFRVGNVLNLAVGDFAMVGAIAVARLCQNDGLSVWSAIPVVLIIVGAIAWSFDRFVLHLALDRFHQEHSIVSVFFYTFGLSLVLEGVAKGVFGTDVYAAPALWKGGPLSIDGVFFQRSGLLTILLAVIAGLVLWAYLKYTVSGRAAAASGESWVGSRIVGIDGAKFRRWMLVMTAMLAALFGVVESPFSGFVYNSGPQISLIGTVAAGFAAFKKPGRAVVAGLAIGLAESLLSGYVSTQYGEVLLYGLLFAVIVLRPEVLGLGAEAA
jgi:branched-chain amino acid transport system permease protein